MMQYDGDAQIPKQFLVEPPAIDSTVSQYLCAAGVTSFAISETQKFGHVTYFWNGNNSGYIDESAEAVRRDSVGQGEVRRAAVDEGGGDHRRGDRGRPVGGATGSSG